MSWIKLDDQWMDHPKIVRAGRDARDVWLASITWCAKHLTDGCFPPELLPSLAVMAGVDVANCQTFAKTLLDNRLWEFTDGQYYIHDYLDYNPTKIQAEATKQARSEAGRAGGIAKASKTPGKKLAKPKQKPAPSPSPSPIKSPRPKEGRGERDPNLDDPAVIAYRDKAKTTPDETQRAAIVGGAIADIERWKLDITHWLGHGWNKRNVTGILAFYQNGGGATCSMCHKQNGSGTRQPEQETMLTAAAKLARGEL